MGKYDFKKFMYSKAIKKGGLNCGTNKQSQKGEINLKIIEIRKKILLTEGMFPY